MRRPCIPRNRSSARLHSSSSAGDMWANGSLRSMPSASASLSGSRVGGSTRSGGAQRCCPHWLVPPRTHLTQSPGGPTCRRDVLLVGALLGCAIRSTPACGHSGLCGFLDPTFFVPPLDPSRVSSSGDRGASAGVRGFAAGSDRGVAAGAGLVSVSC